MQYHFACVWDSFLKLRNVWTTPNAWFYILYSHIYFLFIAFHCIAYTQSALNREYTRVLFHLYSFYFSVCMSDLYAYHFVLFCLKNSKFVEHKNRSSQINQFPLFVLCLDTFLMFDWINLMHSAHNWLTIVVNLQFSVISNPKLLYLVLHLLIVDTMEARLDAIKLDLSTYRHSFEFLT